MFTIKDRGITVSWVPHRHTQYNSTTAHTTATTKRYRQLAIVSHEQTHGLGPETT